MRSGFALGAVMCGFGTTLVVMAITACGPPFEMCEGAECTGGASASSTSTTTTSSTGASGGAGTGGGPVGGAGPATGTGGAAVSSSGSGGSPDTCPGLCAPPVPSGWVGPVAAYVGPAPAGDCGAMGQVLAAKSGAITADASCAACSCGNPVGASCGLPTVTFYNSAGCAGASDTVAITSNNACKPVVVTLPDFAMSARYTTVPATKGTCTPAGGALQADPVTVANDVLLCNVDVVGTCAGDETCVSTPPASYEQGACVHRQGEHACPAAYPHQFEVFTATVDTRACSGCMCGQSTPTCTGTLSLYGTSSCVGAVTATLTQGICTTNTPGSMKWVAGAFAAGSCAPSGGQLSGGVEPGGQVTVCCADP